MKYLKKIVTSILALSLVVACLPAGTVKEVKADNNSYLPDVTVISENNTIDIAITPVENAPKDLQYYAYLDNDLTKSVKTIVEAESCTDWTAGMAVRQTLVDNNSEWEYKTLDDKWTREIDFQKDESWKTGTAPFNSSLWSGKFIYMRKVFELTKDDLDKYKDSANMFMDTAFDDNPIYYLNGHVIYSYNGYKDTMHTVSLGQEFNKYLQEGKNVFAIFCQNDWGGNTIDSSLYLEGDGLDKLLLVDNGSEWEYKIPDDWTSKDYDDSTWSIGQAPFGTDGNPNTIWTGEGQEFIYMRKTFELTAEQLAAYKTAKSKGEIDAYLYARYDENPVFYLNGRVIYMPSGFIGGLTTIKLSNHIITEALQEGTNVFAILCQNKDGGRHIDSALYLDNKKSAEELPNKLNMVDNGDEWKYKMSTDGNPIYSDTDTSWTAVGYGEDSSWNTGSAPFSGSTSNWPNELGSGKNSYIYLRKTFTLTALQVAAYANALMHINTTYDENPVYYLNGHEIHKPGGYISGYRDVNLGTEFNKYLKEGENVFAIYCENKGGGQIIDSSLYLDTGAQSRTEWRKGISIQSSVDSNYYSKYNNVDFGESGTRTMQFTACHSTIADDEKKKINVYVVNSDNTETFIGALDLYRNSNEWGECYTTETATFNVPENITGKQTVRLEYVFEGSYVSDFDWFGFVVNPTTKLNISNVDQGEHTLTVKTYFNGKLSDDSVVISVNAGVITSDEIGIEGFQVRTNSKADSTDEDFALDYQKYGVAFRTVCKAPKKGSTITVGDNSYTVNDVGTIYTLDTAKIAEESTLDKSDTYLNNVLQPGEVKDQVTGEVVSTYNYYSGENNTTTIGYIATDNGVLSSWNADDTENTYYIRTMTGMQKFLNGVSGTMFMEHKIYVRAFVVAEPTNGGESVFIYGDKAIEISVPEIADYIYANSLTSNYQGHRYLYNAILHAIPEGTPYYRAEEVEYDGWNNNLHTPEKPFTYPTEIETVN